MPSITVTFVGGNADRRQLVLSPGCDGMMPQEQRFLGSWYVFDADTNTYRYWPTTGSNDENQFGSPT